jgi:spermidine synthase
MTADAARPLARHRGPAGELALRRRGEVIELVVDGVFAMDSAHTATEEALAALALAALPDRDLDVVVGGLGLGFTCRAVLADPRVRRLRVIELHEVLVAWVRRGLVPSASGLLADERVEVSVADVAEAIPALPPRAVDAVLLDVDNGPGFLVHERNAGLYTEPFLAAAAARLRPGGVLAVWSADPSAELGERLERACGPCREELLDVERDGRRFRYAIYLARCRPTTV